MHSHRLQRRESPPTTTKPPPTSTKSPLPPPLSVSLPSDPDPPTKPQPKIHSNESAHSPLRSDSLTRSDDPDENSFASSPPSSKNPTTTTVGDGGAAGTTAGAIVAVEKYYSPLTSPLPVTPPKDSAASENFPLPLSSDHRIISLYRREEAAPPQTGVAYDGGERKGRVGFVSPPRKASMVNKLGLGFRVLEIAFCLVSFSVMAADKTQGWSGDSFDRYKEYRFCLAVNILGFVYAGFQAYDLIYHMTTGKHVIKHHYRYQFDFIMDQIIAYLLISASSASASRVDDWQSNWGKDEFTEKASASISMAFLAFITFAMSSLISGYNLCTRDLS